MKQALGSGGASRELQRVVIDQSRSKEPGGFLEVTPIPCSQVEASHQVLRLLRQAIVIGTEFTEGRHQFQDQTHIRAMLFDYLWSFGLGMYLWADRWIERVTSWQGLNASRAAEREGLDLITRCLEEAPAPLVGPASEGRDDR